METNAASHADKPKSRRPWFSFSLRTLLIGMTLLAVVCGYGAHEYRIVIERRDWFSTHQLKVEVDISDVKFFRQFSRGNPIQNPSWVRIRLGDQSHRRVIVPASTPVAEKQAAAAIFPEADIVREPAGTVPILRVPPSKMGLSPLPRRFSDRL